MAPGRCTLFVPLARHLFLLHTSPPPLSPPYGIVVSVILDLRPYPNFWLVIKKLEILYVMLVSSGVMFVFLFLCQHHVLHIVLTSYTVIYGPRQSLVSRVSNIIWSFSMIAHTICGRSLYASSLTPFQLYLISLLLFPPSLAAPSSLSNATMGASLTTLAPAPSS